MNSRTFLQYPSVNAAMDGVIKLYEVKLKELNPKQDKITYEIQDLYNYIDSLQEICALVYVYI